MIGQYDIINSPGWKSSVHENAEEQLARLKRRAEKDKIEDCQCLLCGKVFCLIISPTYYQLGLRELCESHALSFNIQRTEPGGIQSEAKWAEATKKGKL